MANHFNLSLIEPHQLARVIENPMCNVLILDSRSFMEFNASHIINAVNLGCAKLMKRRLQQDRLSIQDFLAQNCHWDVETNMHIVVYDQNTQDPNLLLPDSFMSVFLSKLLPVYNTVNVLKGGFLAFQACYPSYCEDDKAKFMPLTSLSQPCLPISDHGPTRILPFLYLGSQHDALNREVLENHNITYELNVSTNCPKPDFIQDTHFMRIPVIDSYSEKLLPHFPQAFQFLDKVHESGGRALVHCLAGISRSATVAIAYVMRHLKMSSDEAYRYVKSKRATISPNFNFLGQLLEYEHQLLSEKILVAKSKSSTSSAPMSGSSERKFYYQCPKTPEVPCSFQSTLGPQSGMFHSYSSKRESTKLHYASKGQTVPNRGNVCQLSLNDSWKEFNVNCIPASSLKELSFVPCQAVLPSNEVGSTDSNHNSIRLTNSWSVLDKVKPLCPVSDAVPVRNNSDPVLFETMFNGCKDEPYKCLNGFQMSLWPTKESLNLSQVTLDSKEYNRSDSTSTSGLGSEGSDFLESLSDYHYPSDREPDIAMDEEYCTVPTDDSEYHSRKLLDLDEASLYGKHGSSLFCDMNVHNHSVQLHDEVAEEGFCENTVRQPKRSIPLTPQEDENMSSCGNESLKCGKSDGLYRAQSCPGILSHDTHPWTPNCNCCGMPSPAFRTRTSKAKKVENRNRYSCSSLDYMEYTSQTGFLKSCTDSSESVPHQMYGQSVIQVS